MNTAWKGKPPNSKQKTDPIQILPETSRNKIVSQAGITAVLWEPRPLYRQDDNEEGP